MRAVVILRNRASVRKISEILLTCHLTQLAGLNQLPVRIRLDTFLEMCQRPLACCSDSHTTLLSRITNIPTLSTSGLHLPEPSATSIRDTSPRNGHRAFNNVPSLLHTYCTTGLTGAVRALARTESPCRSQTRRRLTSARVTTRCSLTLRLPTRFGDAARSLGEAARGSLDCDWRGREVYIHTDGNCADRNQDDPVSPLGTPQTLRIEFAVAPRI